MTLEAESYEAKVSEAYVQMLADSENYQELVEAGSAHAAKNYIIEGDGGEEKLSVGGNSIDISGSWAVVRLGETERIDRAHQTWGYQGEAAIMLVIRTKNNDTPAEAMRRARNIAGLIAQDMQELVGASATRLAYATFNVGEVVIADETGALHNGYIVHIASTWRDIP